ncbi:hypothetical protein [Homoserinimonas sp. OAct 916]|uniref:hypothetical protein n=1 Tax=Homoserinimonas sp. OAct 916 TaxID=2211450 RepID=UPI000DBE562F|nr:hypothetical protein [Homoserinimonas sp. OAct 916]
MQKQTAERIFITLGMLFVVVGGLISAATASAPSQRTMWLVAYLVLIGGAAQIGLGYGQSKLADESPSRRRVVGELLAFNLGNAAVITGTFIVQPFLVDAGGAAIVLSLILFWMGARGSQRRGWLRFTYVILVAVLVVSIPVGLALAHVRAG